MFCRICNAACIANAPASSIGIANADERIIDILDYNKPLPLPHKSEEDSYDNTYKAAMQAVFAEELHITKDLNRKFE